MEQPASRRQGGERRTDVIELLQRLEAKVDEIRAGFPEDDPGGHRRYHEAVIRRIDERAELFRKLRFELTKWGLIGLAAWAAHELWISFLKGPK